MNWPSLPLGDQAWATQDRVREYPAELEREKTQKARCRSYTGNQKEVPSPQQGQNRKSVDLHSWEMTECGLSSLSWLRGEEMGWLMGKDG